MKSKNLVLKYEFLMIVFSPRGGKLKGGSLNIMGEGRDRGLLIHSCYLPSIETSREEDK
jgi:hypothetical protein